MASSTPTWAIPYPQSSDTWCDGWAYMQEMAERVDEILDEFDTDLASSQVIPLARVETAIVQTPVAGALFTFEITNFDTAHLADLAAIGSLTEQDDTYFISGLTSSTTTSGAIAGSTLNNYINSAEGSLFTWVQREPGGSINTLASWAGLYRNLNGADWQATITTTSATLTYAYYWIMKIGDV